MHEVVRLYFANMGEGDRDTAHNLNLLANQPFSKTSFLSELDPSNFSISVKCTETTCS